MSARAALLALAAACAGDTRAVHAEPSRAALSYGSVEAPDGVPLASVSCGSPKSPSVLLVHGFSLSYASFHPLFTAENCARWHLVAFDLRGHGRSGKPWTSAALVPSDVWAADIAAVIRAHGLNEVTLVGWSYGGYVIMDYLRHHGSGRVRAINLVGSTAGLVARQPQPPEVARNEARLGELMTSKAYRDNREGAALFVSMMTVTPQPRDFAADLAASVLMMPPYTRELMRGRALDNRDLAGRIDRPMLLTAGAEDPSVSVAELASLAKRHAGFTLSVYDDGGHMVFADDTPRFVAELARLVEGP